MDKLTKLSDWKNFSVERRTQHLDLNSPCELSGSVAVSTRASLGRKALLTLLQLESDVKNWKQAGLCVRHHCEHHSRNGWCLNPLHLSVGSVSENELDKTECVRKRVTSQAGLKSVELGVGLHNKEKRSEWSKLANNWSDNGRTTTSQVCVSKHDGFLGSPPSVGRHNAAVGARGAGFTRLSPEQAAFVFLWS